MRAWRMQAADAGKEALLEAPYHLLRATPKFAELPRDNVVVAHRLIENPDIARKRVHPRHELL